MTDPLLNLTMYCIGIALSAEQAASDAVTLLIKANDTTRWALRLIDELRADNRKLMTMLEEFEKLGVDGNAKQG